MKNKLNLLLGALLLSILPTFGKTVDKQVKATDDITTVVDSYVGDGLVSFYSAKYNTVSGHDESTSSWANLVGTNYLSLSLDSNNKFLDDSFLCNSTKQYFTDLEVNTVCGNEFSLEILMSDFIGIGADFNTIMNSSNDNFSLFRRVSSNVLEFKFGGVSQTYRPTVDNADMFLNDCLISITYKVGGDVKIYINGLEKAAKSCSKTMGISNLFFGHNESNKKFQASFKCFRFYNKELTKEQVQVNATADGMYGVETIPNHNEVVLGNTNVIGGVNSIRRIDSLAEFNECLELNNLPQIFIYKVKPDLTVNFSDSETASLESLLLTAKGRVIPAFEIFDEETANNLVQFLKKKHYYDCFVLSQDNNLVHSVRTQVPNVMGVIDYTETVKDKDFLSQQELVSIREDLHKSFGTVALLPVRVCNKDTIQYLFDSIVNVWSEVQSEDTLDLYKAVLSGAIGVVTDSTDSFYNIASTKIISKSMTRLPLNIAHRGLPAAAPENTIEGARLAYQNGADVIELDIYQTTDNKVMVMHDASTGRTCNENLNMESCTSTQLRELFVNKGFENNSSFNHCKIPFFEDYLKEFKGKDVRLFVEIKSYKDSIIPLTKALIDQYEMYDQISFISFVGNQLGNLNKDYPGSTTGFLINGILDENSSQEDMLNVMKKIGAYNATLNPDKTGYGKNALLAALSRGIGVYPWTFNTETEYLTYLMNGYCGLTGNDCRYLANFGKTLRIDMAKKDLHVGDTLELKVDVVKYNRTVETPTWVDVKILDENRTEDPTNNKIELKEEGTLHFIVSYEVSINNLSSYYIYSDIITVEVGPKQSGGGNKKTGCSGSIVACSSLVAISSLLGIALLTLKKKKQ